MRIRVAIVVAVMGAILAVGAPAGGLSAAPIYDGDFPDPFVLRDGGTYWAYATGSAGSNLQVTATSDGQTWTPVRDPLPALPKWASFGLTWAPSVLSRAGRYVMYYTTHHRRLDRQCVSVAVASAPGGPFTDRSSGPLVCQVGHQGSIDPSPFVGPDGQAYLLWKSDDNAAGQPTHLWAQRLSADGLLLTGPVVRLLSADQPWQGGIIEGPSMIRAGQSHVLFYGAGDWSSATAGIGYATCSSPLGPCENRSLNGPWLGERPGARGPSGPATVTDPGGTTLFAYHAWPGPIGYPQGYRALFVERLSFGSDGVPILG
jgi:hypothetical protein